MLPKENRLIKKKDFAAAYQKGRTYYAEEGKIALKFQKNKLKTFRIGFVVGKNYSKKAVERNKLKRVLRAIFWENSKLINPGFDIVVLRSRKKEEGEKIDRQKFIKQIIQIISKIK